MPVKKNNPEVTEGVVEEKTEKVKFEQEICCKPRRRGGSFFWGSVLFIFGSFLLLENYLGTDLMKYFWPLMLLLLGGMLIYRSFNY